MARINYVATNSSNPRLVGTIYELLFGMWFDEELDNPESGQVLYDGNVALNLQARVPGMRGGLDHFGLEVEELDAVVNKIKKDYPNIGVIDRPASSPYPGCLAHDPAGSIFAIAEVGMTKVETERKVTANFSRFNEADPTGRYLHHYAIRTKRVAECADFYEDVFGLAHTHDDGEDPSHYLSDGKVSLLLIPWHINDYGGISVTGRGPDHIGFKVEDAKAVIEEIRENFSRYAPGMAPLWLFETVNRLSDESQVMDDILNKACSMSSYHFTDKDGVFVAVGDRTFAEA